MSRLRSLLVTAAALLGFGGRTSRPATPMRISNMLPALDPGVAAATGHRYGSRVSEGGNPPHVWGASAACAQMVRKNRRLRLRLERHGRRQKGGRPCLARA